MSGFKDHLDNRRAVKAQLAAQAKRILDANAGREFTASQEQELNHLKAQMQRAEKDIMLVERFLDEPPSSSAISGHHTSTGPFASLGEQLSAVRKHAITGVADTRLSAGPLGANETVPAEGGFLVQPDFAEGILQRTYDVGRAAFCSR